MKTPYLLKTDEPDQRLSDDETPPVVCPQRREGLHRVWKANETVASLVSYIEQGDRLHSELVVQLRKANRQLSAIRVETEAALTAALQELQAVSPSGAFIARSNVERILRAFAVRVMGAVEGEERENHP